MSAGTLSAGPAAARGRRTTGSLASAAAVGAAVLLCTAWSVGTLGVLLGYLDAPVRLAEAALYGGAVVSVAAAALWRPRTPAAVKLAAAWTAIGAAAWLGVTYVGDRPLFAVAPAALALTAVAVMRWPVASLAAIFFVTGAGGSIDAFLVSPRPVADVLIGGAWIGLAWCWLTGRRELPVRIPPSFVLLLVFVFVTLIGALVVDDLERGLYAFRLSAWYLSAGVLAAYLLDTPRRWQAAHTAFLTVAALVGLYAIYRWIVGPAAEEEELIRQGGPWVLGENNEVRLSGSLGGPTALAVWCSAAVPFAAASILGPFGARRRALAVVALVTCGAALAETDLRAPLAAAAAGAVMAVVLFSVVPAFTGRRALLVALSALVLIGGAGTTATWKLADNGYSEVRFRGLFDPLNDGSMQARLVKWETLLSDVDEHPLGRGLGASGEAETRHARFSTAASFDPDSSYVKIAYDQGLLVLALFLAGILVLIVDLLTRAVRAVDPRRAALASGACAAAVSYAIVLNAGVYYEGPLGLAFMVLIGLGFAAFVQRPDSPDARRSPARAR